MGTVPAFSYFRIAFSIIIIIMTAITSQATCYQNNIAFVPLVPSQAISSKHDVLHRPRSDDSSHLNKKAGQERRSTIHVHAASANFDKDDNSSSPLLVPSQSINRANLKMSLQKKSTRLTASTGGQEDTSMLTSSPLSSKSPNKKLLIQQKKENTSFQRKKTKTHSFKYYGNIPDVHWRAIPMEHLRSHPFYTPLPHPDTIKNLNSLEEVRIFRQDSWQWDALHQGRCTTSQAAPALGLLEPKSAKALGIPRSLQKGCMGAFRRLSQPALRTLEEMNEVLCSGGNGGDKKLHKVWRKTDNSQGGRYPFAAKYLPTLTKEELDVRKKEATHYINNLSTSMRIRMSWGNVQEATSVLTALNYFVKQDPGAKLLEVGMCGAGLDLNVTDSSTGKDPRLIVGASPDSVIQYSNGTLEVLEVKNHCPFVPSDWMSGSKAQKKKKKFGNYRIRELPLQYKIPAAYIPQLMMEMMSCGQNCKSGVMVRQTATNGAVILRIHRDDEWIEEMTYWLRRFMIEYVDQEIFPPPDFFWEGDESERYRNFVQRTKELSEQVELVAQVKNSDIQRVLGARGLKLPLFLDEARC